MRNATDIEKKVIEKQVSNYLWMENLQTFMGVVVCITIALGLFFTNLVDSGLFISNLIVSIILGFLFILVVFVLIDEYKRTRIYAKMLKEGNYTLEDCISRNVNMKMNRTKKEVELVCKYENNAGELSDREYAIISDSKKLCVSDCENKECSFVKFTDNFGFIMINKN
jgi:hypothetical protein